MIPKDLAEIRDAKAERYRHEETFRLGFDQGVIAAFESNHVENLVQALILIEKQPEHPNYFIRHAISICQETLNTWFDRNKS